MIPEDLLSHAGFVQSLARTLVRDEHKALDLMQETWRRAIENPPKREHLVKPWLAKVARNLSISFFRRERSQEKRIQSHPEPRAVASPPKILEKEEVRRMLIDLVLKQPEPYRSVLIFRYYEDLTPMQISKKQGIPLDTIKSQLKRGLKRLKERLDHKHGGDRKEWVLSLAPLAGVKMGYAFPIAWSLGAFLMSLKGKIAVLTIICLLAVSGFWLGDKISPQETVEEEASSVNTPIHSEDQVESQDTVTLEEKIKERIIAAQKGYSISGQVLDKKTGAPVPRFYVELAHREDRPNKLYEIIEHKDGRFTFLISKLGEYSLKIGSSKHLELDKQMLLSKDDANPSKVFHLDPGSRVTGRVVNEINHAPMEGVLVVPVYYYIPFSFMEYGGRLEPPYDETQPYALTDANGCFSLEGLKRDHGVTIVAIKKGFAQAGEYTETDSGKEIHLELSKGYRVKCKTLDDEGEPVKGVRLSIWGPMQPLGRHCLTDEEGAFTFLTKPGVVYITAGGDGNHYLSESKVIHVTNQDVEVCFGAPFEYSTWKAALRSYDGVPIPQAEIHLNLSGGYPWPIPEKAVGSFYRKATTDVEGRFVFHKLPPGPYHIVIYVLKKEGRQSQEFSIGRYEVKGPGLFQEDLILPASGGISGEVIDGRIGANASSGWVTAKMNDSFKKSYEGKISKHGVFTLTGLVPGFYSITASKKGCVTGRLENIEVRKNEMVRGLRIVLPAAGKAIIRLEGLTDHDFNMYASSFTKPSEISTGWAYTGFSISGKIRSTWSPPPGDYVYRFFWPRSKDIGYLEAPITIKPMETTEKVLNMQDIAFHKKPLAIMGKLVNGKGRGLGGVTLHFKAVIHYSWIDADDRFQDSCDVVTGEGGIFDLNGLWPGAWEVNAKLPNGAVLFLPDFHIPMDARSPYNLDLVLPTATITGQVEPVQKAPWRVRLLNPSGLVRFDDTVKDKTRFSFDFAPSGTFKVEIKAMGCYPYLSEPITLSNNKKVDLGKISLTPCGSVILQIWDQNGDVVKYPEFFVNGKNLEKGAYTALEEGVFQINRLPLGPVKIIIRSNLYVDDISQSELDLIVTPGKVERYQAFLK